MEVTAAAGQHVLAVTIKPAEPPGLDLDFADVDGDLTLLGLLILFRLLLTYLPPLATLRVSMPQATSSTMR